jgi:hypothetical protein
LLWEAKKKLNHEVQKSHEVITRTSNEIQQRRLERRIGVGEGRIEERSLF